jgi:hypothetical protein
MKTYSMLCCVLFSVMGLVTSPAVSNAELVYGNRTYPLYPAILDEKPDIPSPLTDADGNEYVIGLTADGDYTIFPVTVENGEELNYKKNIWYAKGRQLDVDSLDFPTLAETGIHSAEELNRTETITGRSVEHITRIGRPEQYSGAGFMAADEDIVSVLKGDNTLVQRLGLTHPELAKPLFHVFNVVQAVMSHSGYGKRGDAQGILYNGHAIKLKFWGAKGWQESIFNDEILGYWEIEMWRELDTNEVAYVLKQYPAMSEEDSSDMNRKLSYIHTGEMVPFYIMRYGFYEGHTGYRADPIAVASIFGLRSIMEIADIFSGELDSALTRHHVSASASGRSGHGD